MMHNNILNSNHTLNNNSINPTASDDFVETKTIENGTVDVNNIVKSNHTQIDSAHTAADHISSNSTIPSAIILNPDTLSLTQLLTDKDIPWQIHNCKIIEKTVTQDAKLPFLYHYDALSDEIKSEHPLNKTLLKYFQRPMSTSEVADLLNIDPELVSIPWQVKITGTLVMFFERQQLALRLKFTNTAKPLEPIYTKGKDNAIAISMQNWHFYGDVFILNKSNQPLIMTIEDDWLQIPRSEAYQFLPEAYSIAVLAALEDLKKSLPQLDDAITLRLS